MENIFPASYLCLVIKPVFGKYRKDVKVNDITHPLFRAFGSIAEVAMPDAKAFAK